MRHSAVSVFDSRRNIAGMSALLFAASSALTVIMCLSMSTMCERPMPGGWTLSMTWTRMPGQTWGDAIVSFLVMWIVMMAAMMLPSLTATLLRGQASRELSSGFHDGGWIARLGAGYFAIWTLAGIVVFILGAVASSAAIQSAVLAQWFPVAAGVLVLLAGFVQFSDWKHRHLARCTTQFDCTDSAWRQGLRLGIHCLSCCGNLTAVLVVIGIMDLRVMVLVTVAITLERLTPMAVPIARGIGFAVVVAGLWMIATAVMM